MSEVRKVVEELQGMESKVDALICNAGVLLNERRESKEGNEITFASHFLGGSFLLSQLLLPQLKASKDQSRVVFVSSGGMYTTKFPDWETATSTGKAKDKYDGNLAYAYAKRGQVLLAEQLTKDVPEVAWVTCHPGWTDTPAVDEAYGESKKYLEPMRKTWEGAEGIAWLMGTDIKELESGAYYLDREPQRKHLAGPFFSEGSFTKNSQNEIDVMMEMLKKTTGL
jgi:dehydrogenase/reductase SDR family protein 12